MLKDVNQPIFITCLLQVGGFSVRKGLAVAQFAISQTLLIGTIVVTSQMRFNSETDMGFKKDAIVLLPVPEATTASSSA